MKRNGKFQIRVRVLKNFVFTLNPLLGEAVKKCLSQSSLAKLVDPRQNKTLEETVTFREKAHVDINQQQLTMSVLHREISRGDIGADFSFPTGSASARRTGFHQITTASSPSSTTRDSVGGGRDGENPSDRDVIPGDDSVDYDFQVLIITFYYLVYFENIILLSFNLSPIDENTLMFGKNSKNVLLQKPYATE